MSEMKDICLRLVLRSKKTKKKNTHAHVLYSAVITTALNNKTFALLVRVIDECTQGSHDCLQSLKL